MTRSPYAFAAAAIIALRRDGDNSPLGVVADDGTPFALAFTDLGAARARIPAGVAATPLSLPMHELARLTPAPWGIVLDVDDPLPQVVAPAQKVDVAAAGGPFPVGADVALDKLQPDDLPFSGALRALTGDVHGITRMWLFRHRVDVLPTDLVVVVAADGPRTVLRYAGEVFETARDLDLQTPVTTVWIDEVPVEHALWIRQQPPQAGPEDRRDRSRA